MNIRMKIVFLGRFELRVQLKIPEKLHEEGQKEQQPKYYK